jgi:hypothetical protein
VLVSVPLSSSLRVETAVSSIPLVSINVHEVTFQKTAVLIVTPRKRPMSRGTVISVQLAMAQQQ